MAITAKVRNKQIDTGKVLHALVQGEHASGNITFQIIGEEELVEDFNSTYFYLLYTRPSDTRPNVLLLTNKQLQDNVISVTFKPTSYFTAQDGTVQIQIMATDTEGLSVDSETGTISGSVIWQTFPGAMFVHASQLTGTETIIEENVLTQYLAGMQDLNTQTEQAATEAQQAAVDAGEDAEAAAGSATAAQNAKTDAVAARDKAQEWATKSDGKVDNIDYSSKHYASAAKASEQKASEWAEKDTPVETGKYSAKHWAEQAHAEFNALDTYVDETLKPALDDYEEAKEGELDTYTATKKADLDTYEGTKETELNTYTGTKKTELDTYTGAKKSELDSYVANTNKPALDSYTNNTLKPALLAYEQTQEGALNTYTGTKKTELDSYVENTTKPSIDDYIEDEKKPEIDAYIAEQAGQFGADVTTLKGNVSALDKRVSNIEESLDVITEIEYPDATYGTGEVPPNKSKYAEVSVLKGVGRIRNSFVVLPQSSATVGGLTVTFYPTEHYYTISNGTPSQSAQNYFMGDYVVQVGHKYLIADYFAQRYGADGTYKGNLNTVTDWSPSIIDTTGWASGDKIRPSVRADTSQTYSVSKKYYPILCDLTVYFNRNIPSGLDIATIQQNYPELLIPSDYGTSVVSPTYTAIKSVGRNLFNPQGATAGVSLSVNGGTYSEASHSTSDYLPVTPNTTYYHKNTLPSGSYIVLCYYDANKTFISAVAATNTTTTSPANAKYIRISYLTADVGQICFNVSDSLNGTYTPYMTDTLTLPSPVTLRSAGSVADTDELNVEIEQEVNGQKVKVEKRRTTQRVKSVVYDGSSDENWLIYGSAQRFYIQKADQKINSGSTVANLTCDKLMVTRKDWVDQYDKAVGVEYRSFVLRIDSTITTVEQLRTWLAQNPVTINYELDTPVVTLSDPIPDPFIQVEGGGTIKPVQTNEPEIDSAMTVTYVNKITA